MLLTKENLLKFIKEKGLVNPIEVSKEFEVNSMVASAALSEVSKNKEIEITDIKIGSSPYYYDISQREKIENLREFLDERSREIFDMIKEKQVINDSHIPVSKKMFLEKLSDFAKIIEFEFKKQQYKFWIYYLRDLNETKKQIIEALKNMSTEKKTQDIESSDEKVKQKEKSIPSNFSSIESNASQDDNSKNIDKFLIEKNLEILEKRKEDRGVKYSLVLNFGFKIYFEGFYFSKKVSSKEILDFFYSSNKPKIIFVKNPNKTILKLNDFENLFIISLT